LMETDERWLTGKRYLNMNTGVDDWTAYAK